MAKGRLRRRKLFHSPVTSTAEPRRHLTDYSLCDDERESPMQINWQAYSVALILMSSLMVASIWAVHGGLG
jgi:hypothetical protein